MRTRVLAVVIGVGLLLAVAWGSRGLGPQDQSFEVVGSGIKSYQVVRRGSVDELEKAVTEQIAQLWRPVGGVCADNKNGYLQAMVLPE